MVSILKSIFPDVKETDSSIILATPTKKYKFLNFVLSSPEISDITLTKNYIVATKGSPKSRTLNIDGKEVKNLLEIKNFFLEELTQLV